jgi:hypothetical protein
MDKENPHFIGSSEKVELHKRDRVAAVIIREKDSERESQVALVALGSNFNPVWTDFIAEHAKGLEKRLSEIKVGHLRRELKNSNHAGPGAEGRSSREITDIVNNQIKTYSSDLSILEGRSMGPITIYLDNKGKPEKVTVGRFSQEELREVWRPIQRASDKAHTPEAISLLVESYSLSSEGKLDDSDESDSFFDRYSSFLEVNFELENDFGGALRAIRGLTS